jgi:FkbM family methyltransferase
MRKKLIKKTSKLIGKIYRKFFTSARFYNTNYAMFRSIANGLGILNYKSLKLSGEDNFLKLYLNSLGTSPVIFDIGACTGSYSKLCKKIKPNSIIYAFEPFETTFETLKEETKDDQIKVYNFGFGIKKEEVMIYNSGQNFSHGSIYQEVLSNIHKYTNITSTTIKLEVLSEFIESNKLNTIDLLKVDTEGHELEILKGINKEFLLSNIGCIHFEFNEMNVVSRVFMKDFFDLLVGFNLYRLLPDGFIKMDYNPLNSELFAYQNIVAIKKDFKLKGALIVN